MKTSIFSSASKQSPHSSERAFASSLRDASRRARTLSQSHASFRSSTAKICIRIHSLPLLFNVSVSTEAIYSAARTSARTEADTAESATLIAVSRIELACGLRASKKKLMKMKVFLFIGLPCRECVQWLSCSHPSRSQRCIDPFGKERRNVCSVKTCVPSFGVRGYCALERPRVQGVQEKALLKIVFC